MTCNVSREAVDEAEEEWGEGCPVCGQPPMAHRPEAVVGKERTE